MAIEKQPVCIIIPPSTFLADERVFPFLGPLKVAAELEKNGNRVEVLDLSGYANYEEVADLYARSSDIKNFALTATTPQIPAASRIVQSLRGVAGDCKISLGGAHVTLAHAGMVEDLKAGRLGRGTRAFEQLESIFDRLMVGDGEKSIFAAINQNFQGKVIDASNPRSEFFLQKGTLEQYAFPARHMIDLDSYRFDIDRHRAFSVIGQLGCPFECGFCGGRNSYIFRMARFRHPRSVVKEIEEVILDAKKRGVDYSGVMFYDDELNISSKTVESLCLELVKLQEKLGLEMRFRGFIKAELFTPEQAKLMYQAGFRMLLCGVESGSFEMLKVMKKHTTPLINTLAMQAAREAGIKFKALMSIGHPGESAKTVEESINWVLKNKPDDLDWSIITEYPGSPYFDRSIYDSDKKAWVYTEEKTGHKLYSRAVDYTVEAEYYKGIPGDYTSYVWTDFLTDDVLVEQRELAEKTTRAFLNLPPITEVSALQFEHSMGQGLPGRILRKS